MARYLSWSGLTTKVFNVGEYRREATQDYRLLLNCIWFKGKLRHLLKIILTKIFARKHEFFNPSNSEAMALRLAIANSVLDESIQWLERGGEVRGVVVVVVVVVDFGSWVSPPSLRGATMPSNAICKKSWSFVPTKGRGCSWLGQNPNLFHI